MDDTICWSYQDRGHAFVVLVHPGAETTWVYDVATQSWHERALWDPAALVWTPHLARCHTFAFDRHLVGDRAEPGGLSPRRGDVHRRARGRGGGLMAAAHQHDAATATPIASLPADITQNVHDAGTTYTVWYTVTVPAGVRVLGAFAFGDLTVYTPILEAPYNAAGTFPTSGQVVATNKPTQFAVTPSTQVWLRIRTNSGNPSPASLRLQVEAAPSDAVPVGAIVVPDDAPQRPAALLDPATGEVLRFISPFPAGEAGDVLANGTMLVSDEFDDLDLKLYSAQFARLMDVPFTWLGVSPTIRVNHGSQTFYVGSPGSGGTTAEVTTVSADGTLGPTTWALPEVGLRAAAASNDNTVLYHSGQATGGSAIRRWNLTTDAAMTDLVALLDADHSVDRHPRPQRRHDRGRLLQGERPARPGREAVQRGGGDAQHVRLRVESHVNDPAHGVCARRSGVVLDLDAPRHAGRGQPHPQCARQRRHGPDDADGGRVRGRRVSAGRLGHARRALRDQLLVSALRDAGRARRAAG